MKRTTLFLLAVTTASSCLFAQTTKNPFSELGYKKQITYTSSKGEFEEFHNNADIVEIGSVYFNTKTNKVVGYINEQKENAEVPTATPAMSVDPLCEKYYWISPYAFCLNNPVNVIDPDGRDAIYITFPKYKADGYPMTGHAGVLLIDNKTGYTKYYEYGRYQSDLGNVRTYSVPNVVMENGIPTAESLNNVLQKISKTSGKGQVLEGAYVVSNEFDAMNNYAKGKLSENNDPNREPYDIMTNNCGTFADDVVKQDASVNAPKIVDPRPVSIIDEYQSNFTPVSYNPNSGTTIKQTNQTVNYDNQTKTTQTKQSWWQKFWYGESK